MTVNPRLIDHFDVAFTQDDVPFAIPHLREDIPLALDPFLLWSSDDPQYRQLHERLLAFFRQIAELIEGGREADAARTLLTCSEPRELGLGYSQGTKRGSALGPELVSRVVHVVRATPQLLEGQLDHIEELQLFVPGVAEDRISDLTGSILRDFFAEYTAAQAQEWKLPTRRFPVGMVWDAVGAKWKAGRTVDLPYNPIDSTPLLLAPLNLLRHLPWINYEDFYRSYFSRYVLPADRSVAKVPKPDVLAYNRANYEVVQRYVDEKERTAAQCRPTPLFEPLRLATLKTKFKRLRATPTGAGGNDKAYEDATYELLSSMLYPELELAASQVRTISGVHIRDVLFYNDGKTQFLRDLRERFGARQLVFELKNVAALETEHVNQLYRYLGGEFGHVGVLVTRNPTPRNVQKNIVDLHSAKRCAVICFDDRDLELMINMLDAKRRPIEVLKKKYIEFSRLLPS